MKVIQVPMSDGLLRAVNVRANARHSTRAALIREACADYLRRLDQEVLEQKYLEGYRRKPESPSVGKLGEKMAREVWPKETWDETW